MHSIKFCYLLPTEDSQFKFGPFTYFPARQPSLSTGLVLDWKQTEKQYYQKEYLAMFSVGCSY